MPARLLVLLVAGLIPVADWLLAAPQPRTPRKVAFLVAVGKYDHKFGDLGTAPENDVTKLAKELAGFEIVTLLGSKPDADPHRATGANVEARFKELLKGGNGTPAIRDGDTVLVLLCGHGIQAEALDPATGKKEDQPFFCPVDARPDDPSTMVPLNALIRASEAFGATSLFLVDACREASDPNRGTRSGIQGKKVNLPAKTAVLFACSAGQLSHQSEKADGGHGLFTFAVLKSLRAGGRVSWGKLVDDVQGSFQGDDFKALLPAGKTQSPVLATGEMGFTELIVTKASEIDPGPSIRPVPSPKPPMKDINPSSPPTGGLAKIDLLPNEKLEEFDYIVNDTEKKRGKRRVLTLDIGGGEKMEFVRIEGGQFLMGSPEAETYSLPRERPQRTIEISPFYLGKYEVTQAQYHALTGKSPSLFKGARLPVEHVSYDDAVECANKGSKFTRRNITLPSEAQWEYACRGGTQTPYHFGAKLNYDQANHDGTDERGMKRRSTIEVGTYKPNPWGLYDMHGNVCEWCQDYFGDYRDVLGKKDPLQTTRPPDDKRVLRGGSWGLIAWGCRSAERSSDHASLTHSSGTGFRLLLKME